VVLGRGAVMPLRVLVHIAIALIMSLTVLATSSIAASIDLIIKMQRSIKTIKADFIQEKHSDLLDKPILSKGTLLFSAPERFVWDYGSSMKVVSDGRRLLVIYKGLKEADLLDVTRFPSLPNTFTIEKLRDLYRIDITESTAGPYVLKLTPLAGSLLIKEMIISLDGQGAPQEVRLSEKSGDRTVIKFSKVRINENIPENSLSLEVPPGVKVRRQGR
jgi:outer membrane lipoprotein-sorting protein